MSENFSFPIPNDVLEPYIRTAVSTSIVAALGDGTKLVEQAVQAALSEKVDADGIKSKYAQYNTQPFVEVLAKKKIREIARECINEMAEQMRPQIRLAIEESIANQGGILATSLEDALTESLSARWSVQILIGDKD